MKANYSLLGILLGGLLGFSGKVISNAWEYHQDLRCDSKTIWYDSRWWIEPFTHIVLDGKLHDTHWTQNAYGTQIWKISTVRVENKTFWTVLQKRSNPATTNTWD